MVEKVLQINREKTIFWTLVGILLLCIGFYMYCINSTVHNVVARQNLETEASQLTLSIGSEEFKYISKRNSITLAMAKSLGFREVSAKTFISKDSANQVSFLSKTQ
jgi:hypothetical protein